MVSPQLLMHRLRRLPQLVTGAAEVHGEARFEHVAQLDEDYARFVAAELRESHVKRSRLQHEVRGDIQRTILDFRRKGSRAIPSTVLHSLPTPHLRSATYWVRAVGAVGRPRVSGGSADVKKRAAAL